MSSINYDYVCCGEEYAFDGKNGEMILSALTELPEVYSQNDAEECLKSLQAITKILKAVGEYEKRILALIRLEISAFEKIAEYADSGGDVSGVRNVEKRYKDAMNVYVNLDKEKRQEVINEATSNYGSFVSYVAAMSRKKAADDYDNALSSASDSVIKDYEDCGFAYLDDISRLATYPKTKSQMIVYDAVRNRTKDRLIRKGAIGIGNGQYISPDAASCNELKEALECRCKSVLADLSKINRILYLRHDVEMPDSQEFSVVMEIINMFREEICKKKEVA